MPLHHTPGLFERLWIFGPLLYLGLMMINDPGQVIRATVNLTFVLRTVEQRFHGMPVRRPTIEGPSKDARRWMRLCGAILTIWSLLPLTGLLR